MTYYILEGHYVVEEPDLIKWGKWFKTANRTVAKTKINKNVTVSTVFLGIDHSFSVNEDAQLFETMVFGGDFSDCQMRYTTWDEAERGHQLAVQLVTGRLLK